MVTIKTYEELENYIVAWCKGYLKANMIIVGDGGLGKSHIIKAHIGPHKFINSHITPMDLYLKFVENPASDYWLQDVDLLLQNKLIVGLLKQALEQEKKVVQWNSTVLPDEIPASIEITGRFLIELNHLGRGDKNLQALKTRALVVDFRPSNSEIQAYLKGYATNDEILWALDKIHPYIINYNLRLYNILCALKQANLDWRKTLNEQLDIIQLPYLSTFQ
jgi:hypothetical protein